jgi:hypothetical protein
LSGVPWASRGRTTGTQRTPRNCVQAREIADDLQAALVQFSAIAEKLKG